MGTKGEKNVGATRANPRGEKAGANTNQKAAAYGKTTSRKAEARAKEKANATTYRTAPTLARTTNTTKQGKHVAPTDKCNPRSHDNSGSRTHAGPPTARTTTCTVPAKTAGTALENTRALEGGGIHTLMYCRSC